MEYAALSPWLLSGSPLLWAMNPILLSLTYLILVRAIGIPLPPLVRVWHQYDLQELLDLHEVMASAAIGQDQYAQECMSVMYFCYNFQSLVGSLQILKNIWHRYVRRTQPLPGEILALGHRLNLRLAGPRKPNFPDAALSQPWVFQCLQLLDSVTDSIDDESGPAAHVEAVSDMDVSEAVVGVLNSAVDSAVEVISDDDEPVGDDESESLSPPNQDDSPPARRAKIDHLVRHSEPASPRRTAGHSHTEVASSSFSSFRPFVNPAQMSMLDRAQIFEERQQHVDPLPETKWGRCAIHSCRYALAPHLFSSGTYAGEIRLLCSQFHKKTDGRRNCWHSVAVPDHLWEAVPKFLKRKRNALPASLLRNGVKP